MIDFGVASRPAPGEAVSGDAHLVRPLAGGWLLAVIDGIGHGRAAQAAAQRAVRVLEEASTPELGALIEDCHRRLQGTRGAVMSLAFYAPAQARLDWLGVGNVEGVLLHPGGRHQAPEFLLRRAGVVGDTIGRPPLPSARLEVRRGDLLVLATDGVASGFADAQSAAQAPAGAAARILQGFAGTRDDALVLAVRLGEVGDA